MVDDTTTPTRTGDVTDRLACQTLSPRPMLRTVVLRLRRPDVTTAPITHAWWRHDDGHRSGDGATSVDASTTRDTHRISVALTEPGPNEPASRRSPQGDRCTTRPLAADAAHHCRLQTTQLRTTFAATDNGQRTSICVQVRSAGWQNGLAIVHRADGNGGHSTRDRQHVEADPGSRHRRVSTIGDPSGASATWRRVSATRTDERL